MSKHAKWVFPSSFKAANAIQGTLPLCPHLIPISLQRCHLCRSLLTYKFEEYIPSTWASLGHMQTVIFTSSASAQVPGSRVPSPALVSICTPPSSLNGGLMESLFRKLLDHLTSSASRVRDASGLSSRSWSLPCLRDEIDAYPPVAAEIYNPSILSQSLRKASAEGI